MCTEIANKLELKSLCKRPKTDQHMYMFQQQQQQTKKEK